VIDLRQRLGSQQLTATSGGTNPTRFISQTALTARFQDGPVADPRNALLRIIITAAGIAEDAAVRIITAATRVIGNGFLLVDPRLLNYMIKIGLLPSKTIEFDSESQPQFMHNPDGRKLAGLVNAQRVFGPGFWHFRTTATMDNVWPWVPGQIRIFSHQDGIEGKSGGLLPIWIEMMEQTLRECLQDRVATPKLLALAEHFGFPVDGWVR